nr:pfs domain-containing protein [Colletotrichum truncatum]KAF6789836.1 pfs domain-containing protein [Colletotrichum truncatum]
MAPLKRLPSPQMYTIGWITALDKELTAAQAMLDEEHMKPENFRKHPKDTNSYIWGRIAEHNIVIASLAAGKYGTVSAATTAGSMTSSLPHLRFGLMVGIGAGIPRLAENIDIRLGDVVVSQPTGTSSGVVQYDLGKLGKDGHFQRVGSLASPPEVLLKGLQTLKAKRRLREPRMPDILKDMFERHPLLAEPQPDDASFVYQGKQNDRLFEATSKHIQRSDEQHSSSETTIPHDLGRPPLQLALAWIWSFFWLLYISATRLTSTNEAKQSLPSGEDGHLDIDQTRSCMYCDPRKELQRRERASTDPMVYYGLIASGDSVIKNSVSRDEIVQRLGEKCICFEMEAAGLMDNFPCLVIRGICDYADGHKNDRWQNYAAVTAAAFAKELLEVLDGEDVEGALRMDEVMEQLRKGVSDINSSTNDIKQSLHFQEIMEWLSPPDPSTNHNKALQQRHEGTGQWFLNHESYSNWKTAPNSSLWLYGIPGCGKTILSTIIIEHLRNTEQCSGNLLYFYFDFTDTSKQSLEKAIRSLIAQLYSKKQCAQTHLDILYSSHKKEKRQPSTDLLCKTFKTMVDQTGEIWIVLDALDECQTRNGPENEGLLAWIQNLLQSQQNNIHFMVTSRPEHDIESTLKEFINSHIPLQSDLMAEDIEAYIRARVTQHKGLERWHKNKEIQDEIQACLMKKAHGMFRWVSCQLDELERCLDPISLRNTLKSLPKTLDDTYARILDRIPPEMKQNAIRILQFLTFSERPLRIEEACDAIAVVGNAKPRFDVKNRMPIPEEIAIYCSSLVVIVTKSGQDGEKRLQLAHFSVREYLVSNRLEHSVSEDFRASHARAVILETSLAYLLDINHGLPITDLIHEYPLAQVQHLLKEFLRCGASYETCWKLYQPDRPWDEKPWQHHNRATHMLCYFAYGGIVYAVEKVLKDGADVNSRDSDQKNALEAASSRGHKDVVRLVLDKGADINAPSNSDYGTALQAASYEGHKDVVGLLLDRGADINAQGGRHGTALQAASYEGHKDVVQLLLDESDSVYNTALQAASYEGHKDVIQLLLDKGADINAQSDSFISTALQAASYEGHKDVVQLLLDRGADINAQSDIVYNTALQVASYEGHKDVVQLLLDRGADINAQSDSFYGTALQAASCKGHEDVIRLLLDRGADINAQSDIVYNTALQDASCKGHKDVIRLLLNRGADINAQGGRLGNALVATSHTDNVDILPLLLDTGADTSEPNTRGQTPLSVASECGKL